MIWRLGKLLCDRRGASAVEYGLILSMVVLAMIGALQLLAGETTGMWNNVSDTVQEASK